MLDHLYGRPNPKWKRTQVFLVILFWLWRIVKSDAGPPRLFWLPSMNRFLHRFSPYQIIVTTLTLVYAMRNFDKVLGLQSPEPLANLYSPSYYRATWIATGLDAGFATAMSIKPKWLRDICSMVFSGYYIMYPNEADEKLRRFRAVPTVEMLRVTWEKTSNPWIKAFSPKAYVSIRKKIILARPKESAYTRPITVYLFFSGTPAQLRNCSDLIFDIPGGGFIAMNPEHHEDRLRLWARATNKPVISLDYGKAPEYPYPFAIEEAFDLYRLLFATDGSVIGMESGRQLKVVMTGDSAGGCIAVNVMFKILEYNESGFRYLPKPHAMALSYAALDFNFTSWMTPANLRVLRTEESSGNLKELAMHRDHLNHVSPLDMTVERPGMSKRMKRKPSWKDSLHIMTNSSRENLKLSDRSASVYRNRSAVRTPNISKRSFFKPPSESDTEDSDSDDSSPVSARRPEDTPLQERVKADYFAPHSPSRSIAAEPLGIVDDAEQGELSAKLAAADEALKSETARKKEPLGTRVTMASRTGYFGDRIISPSLMRAMAILYIGPHHDPDFGTDYKISPVLCPSHILAGFPPLLLQCGEADPFVDDSVVFAGRVREAKRERKRELDLALSGKSARFGESLRISGTDNPSDARKAAMRRERDKLARETEDDWAQIDIFAEWSHGYLQMPLIMPEAYAVIHELAEWIDDAFVRFDAPTAAPKAKLSPTRRSSIPTKKPGPSPYTTETETDDAGITFVPRKYQQKAAAPISDARVPSLSERMSSPETASDSTLHDSENNLDLLLGLADGYELSPNDQDGYVKAAGPRQTGQTISEMELVRRRRLLDSHLNSSMN
ncbi:alpha/beta-hydrolase [Cylindrobasidium torrendii FP15055 ss-10]|uniref:Alpha/beta-hydrolase n=1 Tax=Cylindrobasidium torrendii FP15055 ss-10 TaxID=1314674 RepID=A0A0D7BV91_9AGAR|nr:alpha/beta-hydrolase [Cylindrobasidium torrendii FP15055 ss-10]